MYFCKAFFFSFLNKPTILEILKQSYKNSTPLNIKIFIVKSFYVFVSILINLGYLSGSQHFSVFRDNNTKSSVFTLYMLSKKSNNLAKFSCSLPPIF